MPAARLPATRPTLDLAAERAWLETLYRRYHQHAMIDPDPLQVVLEYADPADQEIVGLLAALLAYGRVSTILNSLRSALKPLGPSPASTLQSIDVRELDRQYRGFRHRFTTGRQMAALLRGAQKLINRHGSLGHAFVDHLAPHEPTILSALIAWTDSLRTAAGNPLDHFLPDPGRPSACKRLHLYLRWMVRRDVVDPGPWRDMVHPRQLIMPVDTHVHKVARLRGWTARKTVTRHTVEEITAVLRRIRPNDPLRYDFAITRPGIRNELHALRST
jgi:uncharacterized protein (TIGR02757 family)